QRPKQQSANIGNRNRSAQSACLHSTTPELKLPSHYSKADLLVQLLPYNSVDKTRCNSGSHRAIHLCSKVGWMSQSLLFHFQSWLTIGLAITLFLVRAAGAAAFDKRVAIVSADFSERAGLFFVAKDQRFFEEQGVDADVVQVRSGPIAISALAAGEAQF